MGRLLVIVLVLAAIAFFANKFLLQGGDAPPKEFVEQKAAEAKQEEAAKQEVTQPKTGDQPAGDEATSKQTKNEEEALEEMPHAGDPVGKNPADPEAVSPQETTQADPAEVAKAEEAGEEAEQEAAAEKSESILLGTDELYDGIPGDGKLTLQQVETWVAEPKNHVVLEPELPLGLRAGAANIKGIKENPLTRAKIELGRQLFFDPRISVDNSISCASCHHPDDDYARDTQFGVGVDGQQGTRNSPVAYNRILSDKQFWDGRAPSLEEQAKGPIANPVEMANSHDATVADLKTVPEYVLQFEAVFGDGQGDDAVEIDNAAKAIAAFERTLVTGPTPWDIHNELEALVAGYQIEEEYLDELEEEDPQVYKEYLALKDQTAKRPLSESARRGGELFFGDKAGCTQCHLGANFSDEKYHNLGVGMNAEKPDLGRFDATQDDKDRGAFKTPTVRNVSLTGPYMHDGSQKTLEEVVEWYAKGGEPNDNLSDKIKKLDLTDQNKQDLVNFMKTGLQGDLPKVERERIPAGAKSEGTEEALTDS